MKRCVLIVSFCVFSMIANKCSAAPITLEASGDTFINDNNGLGGPNVVQDSNPLLVAAPFYSAPSNNLDSYPLMQFDLTAYSGQTVVGDATLSLFLMAPTTSSHWFSTPRELQVGEILTPSWDPATVTLNNFPANTGSNSALWDVNYGGIQYVTLQSGSDLNKYVDLVVPGSVIQNWIDNPADNGGLIVRSAYARPGFFFDLLFASLENSVDSPPLLSFEMLAAVPETSSLALALLGMVGTGFIARRKRVV